MSVCRACGAEILWLRTQAGKLMPCDAGLHPYWRDPQGRGRVVTADGEVLACSWTGSGPAAGLGYVPHWASCGKAKAAKVPEAEQMRIF